jgi:hypothetical protein
VRLRLQTTKRRIHRLNEVPLNSLRKFGPYVDGLEALITSPRTAAQVELALDGGPSAALRQALTVEHLRDDGIFFTPRWLARRAVTPLATRIGDGLAYCDPACGAGDLLVACARVLPLGSHVLDTLNAWGQLLIAFDLHRVFVRLAKIRLTLLALSRHRLAAAPEPLAIDSLFPRFRVGDGLAEVTRVVEPVVLLLNPPYCGIRAPSGCEWASGKVTQASLFVAHCVETISKGSRLITILPDVLRSGPRYQGWRLAIQRNVRIDRLVTIGRFAPWADVEVFVSEMTVQPPDPEASGQWFKRTRSGLRLSDLFHITVGSVVPHRHPPTGPKRAYVTARSVKPWATVRRIVHKRGFSGSLAQPPFVVVRRTARPGQRCRAVGSIITGQRAVAVENHLIVLRPRDGSERTCRRLVRLLRKRETSTWLDERHRSHHMTTTALSELLWPTGSNARVNAR